MRRPRSTWQTVAGLALIPVLVLACLLPVTARAADGDVALVGLVTRTGSLSQGGTTPAVLLRWDAIEGDLPETLETLRLYRGGALLATLPAHGHLGADAILTLYAHPDNERRRLEMLRWLDAEDPEVAVDDATLGEAIADKLDTDSFWAWLAGRIDPVVARARYRAWVDTGASGVALYRLEGTFASGVVAELGRVTVDTAALDVAPAALGFHQIEARDVARCDAPEAFKAHGAVALDWDAPGATAAERIAADLQVAGWDLFRSAAPVGSAPARDLRAEAELLPHGLDGRVALPGLVQVNDQPLLVPRGLPDHEAGYAGWAPSLPAWREVRADLEAVGVRPGEKRAYYLVPRDVSGNWGATAKALVKVPDLVPPPAPWEVRAVPRPAIVVPSHGTSQPDRMVIRWPEMSVLDFARQHPLRTWCNLEEARLVGRLRWADGALCPPNGEGAVLEANLDVATYRVYRFDNAADARRFTDADGDGFADLDERVDLTDPGAACDPVVHPLGAGARVAVVSASAAVALPSGRRVLQFEDTTPASTPGMVHWYRIGAVAKSGVMGPLSAPVRAVFPDYRRKSRLTFGEPPSGPLCTPYVDVVGAQSNAVGRDEAAQTQADKVVLSCSGQLGYTEWHHGLSVHGGDPTSGPFADKACNAGDPQQGSPGGNFGVACRGQRVRIRYFQGGELVAHTSVDWTGDPPLCSDLHSVLRESCPDLPGELPGHVGTPGIALPDYDPEQGCLGVYRDIGGRIQRVELICGEVALPDPYDVPTLGGDRVCLYTAVHDENALTSPRLSLGCVSVAEVDPEPPQLLGLSFDPAGTLAIASIRPPDQRLVGTLVEWSREDGTDRASTFVPQPAERGVLGQVEATVDLAAPAPVAGASERWCFRARSVVSKAAGTALDDTLSAWSPTKCETRLGPTATPSEYLPWPSIPTPPEQAPLAALYLPADGFGIVHLASFEPDPQACPTQVPSCDPKGQTHCWLPLIPLGIECSLTCADVEAMVRPSLGFVAYRQSRTGPGAPPTSYAQVSPLIDRMHCSSADLGIYGSTTIGDPYIALLSFSAKEPWRGAEFYFLDGYPHAAGEQLRYQLVYFDVRGEITHTRTSNWITAEEAP